MGEKKQYSCGCSSADKEIRHGSIPVVGRIATEAGNIDVVSTKWRICDHIGEIKVRLGIGRMNYAIVPGVYAVGQPDPQSPVLVSANYKLSFDVLRRELEGLNVWILVIDTKGVNVWCAAGEGTFGSQELVERVKLIQLEKIVSTRKLIVPQLGAPGISAHEVKALCGFQVVYGPVRACDLKRFLDAGMKADLEMRRVYFGVMDRLTVSWLELALATKPIVFGTALLVGLIMLTRRIPALAEFKSEAWMLLVLFWAAVLSGTILNAVFLPFLPGRAFSFKGGVLGALICAGIIYMCGQALSVTTTVSFILMGSAVSAFLALNFTGASTYTSLSGVKKEVKYSIPVMAAMASTGVLLEVMHVVRKLI
jgi:hypothetical protein